MKNCKHINENKMHLTCSDNIDFNDFENIKHLVIDNDLSTLITNSPTSFTIETNRNNHHVTATFNIKKMTSNGCDEDKYSVITINNGKGSMEFFQFCCNNESDMKNYQENCHIIRSLPSFNFEIMNLYGEISQHHDDL